MGRGDHIVSRPIGNAWRWGSGSVQSIGAGLEPIEEPQRSSSESPFQAALLELAGEFANHLAVGGIDLAGLGKMLQT